MSIEIRDQSGKVIGRSRNLRGIRAYVGKHIVKVCAIDQIGQWEGKLLVLFESGASCETNFASWTVLKMFVRNWRNMWGAPLRVNGIECGAVSSRNAALQDCPEAAPTA
jgi:hypothetical protein